MNESQIKILDKWIPRVGWIIVGIAIGIAFMGYRLQQDALDDYIMIGGFEYRLVPVN
jgi:hypothetical protein